jgi:hypothetical protein
MDFRSMLLEQLDLPDVGDQLFLSKDSEFPDIHDFYSMKRLKPKKFKSGLLFTVMDFEGTMCELKPKDDDIIVNVLSAELKNYFKEK